MNNAFALVFTAVCFICGSESVPEYVRGTGIVYASLQDPSMIQCQKSNKLVPFSAYRDIRCDCDPCPDCPPTYCTDPTCSACSDATDELWCGPGKCISDSLYNDNTIDCPWHCVESAVYSTCVSNRERDLKQKSDMNPRDPRNFCKSLENFNFPEDCKQTSNSNSTHCAEIKRFFDFCSKVPK